VMFGIARRFERHVGHENHSAEMNSSGETSA